MSGPITRVVIGATEPAATAEFLSDFGFVTSGRHELGAAEARGLWGSETTLECVGLVSSARSGGPAIEVIPTFPSLPRAGWAAGPAALDVYVHDLDVAIAALEAVGRPASPIGAISMGPMVMRQALFSGPDGLAVVLVESTHRRSSVLDADDAASFSEPHSVVWIVDDQEAEKQAWTGAGWTAGPTINFEEPSISDEMGLPEQSTAISMTTLSDEAVSPCRLELMSFDEHRSPGTHAERPVASLPAGVAALAYEVSDIDGAVTAWGPAARFGETVTGGDGSTRRRGVTHGGIGLLLESSPPSA